MTPVILKWGHFTPDATVSESPPPSPQGLDFAQESLVLPTSCLSPRLGILTAALPLHFRTISKWGQMDSSPSSGHGREGKRGRPLENPTTSCKAHTSLETVSYLGSGCFAAVGSLRESGQTTRWKPNNWICVNRRGKVYLIFLKCKFFQGSPQCPRDAISSGDCVVDHVVIFPGDV